MEILFVSHKFPPLTGGMEKQSFELINGMKSITAVHTIVYEGNESRIKFFMTLNRRILNIVKEHPTITIIHFNDGLIAAVSLFHRKYRHLKRTLTFHGLDVVFPAVIYQRFIFPLFNRFDLMIAVSSATAKACETRGLDKKKIVVVNNGVDTGTVCKIGRDEVDRLLFQNYHTKSKNKRILVAIGRPVKRKGFSWFIKNVMPRLNRDFILLIIGPVSKAKRFQGFDVLLPKSLRRTMELFLGSPSDEYLVEQLVKGDHSGNVTRLGKLPSGDIQAILSVADAFVMPNIEVTGDMEGFGLVCLEACMCGTTVFAASNGGITDAIIHGKNGILIPSGDAGSWVKSLNQLIEEPDIIQLNPDEIISFTQNHFSWQKMCAEYFAHFSKL